MATWLEFGGNLKRFLGAFKLCLNSAFLEADNDSARNEKKILGYTVTLPTARSSDRSTAA